MKSMFRLAAILLILSTMSACFHSGEVTPAPNYNPYLLKAGKYEPANEKMVYRKLLVAPRYQLVKPKYVKAGQPIYIPEKVTPTVSVPPVQVPANGEAMNNFIMTPARREAAQGKSVPSSWPQWTEAQAGYKDHVRYSSSYFDVDQGLNTGFITKILEDRRGWIWIATLQGLNVWNGSALLHFTKDEGLTHERVWDLCEDRNGNIWIGTMQGLSLWDGGGFTHFTQEEGLINNFVQCILEDHEGKIWIGTRNGLNVWDGKGFTYYTKENGLAGNFVQSMMEDQKGNIWIGTRGNGLCKWVPAKEGRPGFFLHYTEDTGLCGNIVTSIAENPQGNIWVGTRDGGLCVLNTSENEIGSGGHFRHYAGGQGLSSNNIGSLLRDRRGDIWIGTGSGALSIWDGTGFRHFSEKEGLTSNAINDLFEDSAGNIWIGTQGGGLIIWPYPGFVHFTTDNGLSTNSAWCLLEDSAGRIWIGTSGGGLNVWDPNRNEGGFVHYTVQHGLSSNQILSLLEDKAGNIWIGTNGQGVNVWDGSGFTRFPDHEGLKNSAVRSLLEDQADNIWIGTWNNGVYVWDGKGFTNFTEEQGLTDHVIEAFLEDQKGRIWIGTRLGGISIYDPSPINIGDDGEERIGGSFTNYTSLSGDAVWSFLEDSHDHIWVGAFGQGLSIWDGEGFANFTKKEGLNSNTIHEFWEYDGEIWAGSTIGLHRFTFHDHLDSIGLQVYLKPDGLAGITITDLIVDRQNRLWISTTKGVSRLDLSALQPTPSSPRVYIHELSTFFNFIDWRKTQKAIQMGESPLVGEQKLPLTKVDFDSIYRFANLPVDPVFPHYIDQLTLSWSGIDWSAPHKLKYSYLLEGQDQYWSPLMQANTVTYQDLRPGDYTFKIRAVGANSKWSETATYSFSIQPPWWQSWWARSLYVVSALLMVFGYVQWRTATLKKRQKELENVVAERTAEVVSQKEVIQKEKERSDELLLNILPSETAEELKQYGTATAKNYDTVTVLFTDFKDFTLHSERLSPEALVAEIDHCYKAFDHIMEQYQVEKIKTIGDSYMAAGGLPTANTTNPVDVVKAALAVRDFMLEYKSKREEEGKDPFEIRIGIHTGPVVAGIVGIKKFAYDIWGDTVNIAARIESSSEVGKVNISQSTYDLLKRHSEFSFTPRGKISVKNKGEINMYFVS